MDNQTITIIIILFAVAIIMAIWLSTIMGCRKIKITQKVENDHILDNNSYEVITRIMISNPYNILESRRERNVNEKNINRVLELQKKWAEQALPIVKEKIKNLKGV